MDKLLTLLVVVNIQTFVTLSHPSDETPPQLDGRIIGGESTTIQQFPYQVSLRHNGFHFCGGSIYKSNIIITAAHCVKGEDVTRLTVVAGTSYTSQGGIELPVQNYTFHSKFSLLTCDYDVAVLLLQGEFSFSESIQPIEMTSSVSASRAGTSVTISGWGYLQEHGYPSDVLQYVVVNTISEAECVDAYPRLFTDRMICARAKNKDACNGDSGGPMVVAGRLAGIVSWGNGCADPKYPGVYSNVAILRSWIEENSLELLKQLK